MAGSELIDRWRTSVRQALNAYLGSWFPVIMELPCVRSCQHRHYEVSSALWRAGDRRWLAQIKRTAAANLAFFQFRPAA